MNVICEYCKETQEQNYSRRTWQQWQCGVCGSWNDHAGAPHPNLGGKAQREAARAMLAALQRLVIYSGPPPAEAWQQALEAIAQAEAAGIVAQS